jgi:hypothetical protein
LSYEFINHEIQANLKILISTLQPEGGLDVLTYGATPATVGMIPLYRAGIPPSVLYIVTIVVHIPGSFVRGKLPSAANEADWIERRVRTISRGYVKNTDVIPAAPPQTRRLTELMSPPGVLSKNCSSASVFVEVSKIKP